MTHRLAVFGNPVAHSLSPEIHQMFAVQAGIDLTYEKVLVPLDEFRTIAGDFFNDGGTGINITVPFKEDAFRFVDSLSDGARDAGAVNTILRLPNGSLKGDNTDGAGLASDLQNNLGWPLAGKSILLLGAGGAVQGVVRDILNAGPKSIVVANRTVSKAQEMAARFEDIRVSASPLGELFGPYDIIISGSSAGLSENAQPLSLSPTLLGPQTCCYDMIYGKTTPFQNWCLSLPRDQRADGLGMLVEQAARAFELWFDVEVNGESVLNRLRKSLKLLESES